MEPTEYPAPRSMQWMQTTVDAMNVDLGTWEWWGPKQGIETLAVNVGTQWWEVCP